MSREPPDLRYGAAHSPQELCLLTGATGFIGGHVAERLVREGYRVRCLVRARSDTSALEALEVELAHGDLLDATSLITAAEDCRAIVHCAALVSDWATVEEITRVNVTGTRNVLKAATAVRAERFVHLSTTDVYGYPGIPGIDENYAPTGFSNWYAQTKRGAEGEVRRVQQTEALNAVILRPATVYGPRSKDVVGDIARAIRARQMLLVNGGRAVAGLLYVDNLLDAVVLALRDDAALGNAFNVTDGLDVTWKQFLADLSHALGCPEPHLSMPFALAFAIAFALEHGYRITRRMTKMRTRPLLSRQAVHVLGRDQDFSSRSARETLGWTPRVSYQDGLAATVAWLRDEYLPS